MLAVFPLPKFPAYLQFLKPLVRWEAEVVDNFPVRLAGLVGRAVEVPKTRAVQVLEQPDRGTPVGLERVFLALEAVALER